MASALAYLNLASLRFCTESEGPGKRFAIWVQGCGRSCPGCCNVELQAFRKNKIVAVEDVFLLIKKAVEEHHIEGITLLGGEPILQARGLAEIAMWCQEHGLSVLVFTGYRYEELLEMDNAAVQELLKYTDVLVDGPYEEDLYDEERSWIGSKNQKVYFLTERYPKGIEYEGGMRSMEVFVSEEEVLVNGWPF